MDEWNDSKHPYPNGCRNEIAYKICLKNNWTVNGYCKHPKRFESFNYATKKDCRPGRTRAAIKSDPGWCFEADDS
jgi:hypothetical protein